MGWAIQGSNPTRDRRFFPSRRQARLWNPDSLLFKWVPGFIAGVKWLGMHLTIHLHLVWRLKMSAAIPALTLCAFMVCKGQLYFVKILAT
jgi:hypothetical protein